MISICRDCSHRKGYFITHPKSGGAGIVGVVCERPAYTVRYIPLQDHCISFEPIASKDSCNGDCEHCANRDEWKEWAK